MSYIFNRSFPNTRLRRLRYNDNIRAMVQETSIEPKHLIAPVFVIEGKQQRRRPAYAAARAANKSYSHTFPPKK